MHINKDCRRKTAVDCKSCDNCNEYYREYGYCHKYHLKMADNQRLEHIDKNGQAKDCEWVPRYRAESR